MDPVRSEPLAAPPASRWHAGFALVPALLLLVLDTGVRVHLATLLELHHHDATRAAAIPAALLGATRDLVWVLPAYALWALWAHRGTRVLTHAAFATVLAIVAADCVYFYITFEHVEPVLFVNFNALSIRGTLGWGPVGWTLVGVAAIALLSRANRAALLRAEPAGPLWRGAAVGLAGLAVGLPLATAEAVRVPLGERSLDQLLNETRNSYLAKIEAPIVGNLAHAVVASRDIETERTRPHFEAYTGPEREVLAELGLPPAPHAARAGYSDAGFTRIVVLVLESLPAAYLHHYNPRVPAEATPVLDGLLARYPHLDRYYTSNMPSDWGLNSMFLSRLRPEWSGGRPSLLSVLREARGFESFYVRGVSKHYGNELATYPRLFQMDHYYAFEELAKRYDEPWRSSWGFNNEVVYAEGLRILKEHRDERVVVVLKTIDLHQPGPFEGIPRKYLPARLKEADVGLYNALHWADGCVGRLFDALKAERLFDNRTLVVVTSDHSPHPGLAYKETVPAAEYERLGRLPLILATPNVAALATLDTEGYASQLDLAPTLLALLGVDAPEGFQGRSLLGRDPTRYRVGVYRDTLYYGSPRVRFSESVGESIAEPDASQSVRNRTLRKWLRNQDAELPPRDAGVERLAGAR